MQSILCDSTSQSHLLVHSHAIGIPKFHELCSKHLLTFGRTMFLNKDLAKLVRQYTEVECTSDCVSVMSPFVLGDDLRQVLSATVPNLPSLITPAMLSNAIAYALPGLRDLTMRTGRYLSRQLSETRSVPVLYLNNYAVSTYRLATRSGPHDASHLTSFHVAITFVPGITRAGTSRRRFITCIDRLVVVQTTGVKHRSFDCWRQPTG